MEQFPAEWPEEVQQMFRTVLLNGVLATVRSFDGSANVLSLTLPTEKGGGHLTDMILEELRAQTKSNPCPATPQRADKSDSCTPIPSPETPPDCPQPKSIPEIQKGLESTIVNSGLTMTPEQTPQPPQQNKNTSAASLSGWLTLFHWSIFSL